MYDINMNWGVVVAIVGILVLWFVLFSRTASEVNQVMLIMQEGDTDKALDYAKKLDFERELPHMKDVPDEGMQASNIRRLALRMFQNRDFKYALSFYKEAGKMLDGIVLTEKNSDKDFETAKNFSDLASCHLVLNEIAEAKTALAASLDLMDTLPAAGELWQGILLEQQMMFESWSNAGAKLADAALLERVNKQFPVVKKAYEDFYSRAEINDYWYRWPQVAPVTLDS